MKISSFADSTINAPVDALIIGKHSDAPLDEHASSVNESIGKTLDRLAEDELLKGEREATEFLRIR